MARGSEFEMGFRFRKSITIVPGVRLNLSKTGISTSIGRSGATINIGKRGVRGTVGLPGTGLSYSEMLSKRDIQPATDSGEAFRSHSMFKAVFVIVVCAVVIWMLFGGSHSSANKAVVPVSQAAADEAQRVMPKSASTSVATVMADVNCRAKPRKAGALVATLPEGSSVNTITSVRGWTEVQTLSARCWVVSDYIG